MKTVSLILALLFSIPNVACASFFSNSTSDLDRAHDAYLSGNFSAMTSSLRRALEKNPHDSLMTENAMALLQKAYEVRGSDGLPADWKLPSKVMSMKVNSRRRMKDTTSYQLRIGGDTTEAGVIRQLQVKRFPDQIVVDKQAKIGEWSEGSGVSEGETYHWYDLTGPRSSDPNEAGLYLLRLELTDGTVTEGWFLLTPDMNSTDTPEVLAPAHDQVYTTGNPTFRFKDFVSPQYKPSERRVMFAYVVEVRPSSDFWEERYGLRVAPPNLTEITIGSTPGSELDIPKLAPANYVFSLTYSERSKFGPLTMSRESSTQRQFSVK